MAENASLFLPLLHHKIPPTNSLMPISFWAFNLASFITSLSFARSSLLAFPDSTFHAISASYWLTEIGFERDLCLVPQRVHLLKHLSLAYYHLWPEEISWLKWESHETTPPMVGDWGQVGPCPIMTEMARPPWTISVQVDLAYSISSFEGF